MRRAGVFLVVLVLLAVVPVAQVMAYDDITVGELFDKFEEMAVELDSLAGDFWGLYDEVQSLGYDLADLTEEVESIDDMLWDVGAQLEDLAEGVWAIESLLAFTPPVDNDGNCRLALQNRMHPKTMAAYLQTYPRQSVTAVCLHHRGAGGRGRQHPCDIRDL